MKETIFDELDELIGDFLELSGQQYVVKSTILIEENTVCIEETESLQPVKRTNFKPSFIAIPHQSEYSGDGLVKFYAVVSGVPRPRVQVCELFGYY